MNKLIEGHQEVLIKCDYCTYKVPNKTGKIDEPIEGYINKPCPECGSNLLTEKDYNSHMNFLKVVNFLNKWFSWTTFFSRKKKVHKYKVNVHNGINFKKLG